MSNYKGDFYVGDGFRTNPESHIPGGYDVKVFMDDGSSKVYSRIKNTQAYIKKVMKDPRVTDCKVLGPSKN